MINVFNKNSDVIGSLHFFTCHPGLDVSVPCIIFLKNSKLQQFSSATALLSSGVMGQCYKSINYSSRLHFTACNNVCLCTVNYVFFSYKGCINLWSVLGGGKFVGSFKAVRYLTNFFWISLLDIKGLDSSFSLLSLCWFNKKIILWCTVSLLSSSFWTTSRYVPCSHEMQSRDMEAGEHRMKLKSNMCICNLPKEGRKDLSRLYNC